jgi:DNA-binding winged helix-turn-helix (wHTH) protein
MSDDMPAGRRGPGIYFAWHRSPDQSDYPAKRSVVRFSAYEFNLNSKELRREGMRIRLEGQPLAIPQVLLDRPGELVTREELPKKLWPVDTFVDFEHSLNAAVKRLRAALNDSHDKPRYIETLARRGYRLVAPVGGFVAKPESENPVPVPSELQGQAWVAFRGQCGA